MKSILSQDEVFITGGGGFIGSHITKKLVDLGYRVHLLWRKKTNVYRLRGYKDKIIFHYIDIFNRVSLTQVLERINPKTIIHLSTYSDYRDQEKIEEIMKTSIFGTLNMLMASKNIPYELFINTGSSSEYGLKNKPMSENDKLDPSSFYAIAKVSATHLCKTYSDYYNKPIVTLRPFSVYGPMEDESRFVPTIIKSLINKESILLTPGKSRRDFIFIDDVVNAYMVALKKGRKLKGEIFNIGTGYEFTNDEVVKNLFEIAEKKVKVEKGKFKKRVWDSEHWVADVSHSKKGLGWTAKHSLSSGLKKTYFWYKNNNVK